MSYSVSETREVWEKIGTKDVKLYSYSCSIITPEFCMLWNEKVKLNKTLFNQLLALIKKTKKKKNERQDNKN